MTTLEVKTDTRHRKPGHRRNYLLRCAVAAVAAASAGQVSAVLAQESGKQYTVLEEVVVTARRRQELLQDVPIAVTALGDNFLRQQNITELADLGVHVPSLRISSGGPGTNSPVVTLRGQRPSEVLLTLDPAIPLYFAEVVLTPTEGTNLAMYDLANVQVLKGPQGTLFGRNSTGGALLFTPQAPGTEFGGYGEVRLGNYDLVQFEGAVDLPVNDDMQFRLAGRSLNRDGYQDNVADLPLAKDKQFWDENSYGGRISMAWAPTDRLENNLVASYDQNEMHTRVAVPTIWNSNAQLAPLIELIYNQQGQFDDAIARQNKRDWTKIESDVNAPERVYNTFVSNITEYELTDELKLKNVFGYRNLKVRNTNDADGTSTPFFGAITSKTLHQTTSPPLRHVDTSQYSEELQLLGDSLDGDLEWIVGGYWMQMDGSERFPSQVVGANPDWPPDQTAGPINYVAQNGFLQVSPNGNVKNEAWAVFGEATYTFNDEWALTLGGRQSWDNRELDAMNFAVDTSDQLNPTYGCAMRDKDYVLLPDDQCERDVKHDFDHFTYRASLSYTPTDDQLIYATIATGYRTGGFNARGTDNFTLQPFDEETVTNYELGNKGEWEVKYLGSVRSDLAVFYQEYDDIQKTVSSINPETDLFQTYTINAAKATLWGGEWELTIAPTDDLLVSLGYSHIHWEYDKWDREVEIPPRSGNIETFDYTQANFLYVPKNTVTGNVNYTLPLDPDWGEFVLNANVYFQDHMDKNDDPWLWQDLGWTEANLEEALNNIKADSYYVWNFRLDWNEVFGSGFDVSAYVNNAFDEDYITGGLSIPKDLGMINNTYGAPRTYGAVLRYTF